MSRGSRSWWGTWRSRNRRAEEEGFDFGCGHGGGVAEFVEADEACDPVDVGLFGADGVVFEAQRIADLIEQFPGCWLWFHRRVLSFDRFRFPFYNAESRVTSPQPAKEHGQYMIRKMGWFITG